MYGTLFTTQAELHKALAHPRRLEIIQLLRDQELPVTDIFTMLDLPQANISQHLTVLRDAGVVTTRKEGKQVFYSITSKKIVKMYDFVRQLVLDTSESSQEALEAQMPFEELLPLVTDPVCGMRVSPKTADFKYEVNGRAHFFCASGCYKVFVEGQKKA